MNLNRTTARLVPALGFVACLSAACGPDFDPYERLTSLRVLAIQTEPVAPAPGETSLITPLVYLPEGKTATYSWSWCPLPGPASAGYPCLLDEAALRNFAAAQNMTVGTLPPFDLGTMETPGFTHGIDPKVLNAICSGVLSEGKKIVNCDGGFPVQLKLTVRLADGSDQVTAVSTFRLRLDTDVTPNGNPVLQGLTSVDPSGAVSPLDDAATVELPRLRKAILKAVASPASAEPYKDRDRNDLLVDATERLYISWFVESGDIDAARTTYIAGEIPFDCATARDHCLTQNKWRPASEKDYPAKTARLIAVLRDNRGGVSWRTAVVTLKVAP